MEISADKLKEHQDIQEQIERYGGHIEIVENKPWTPAEKEKIRRRCLGIDSARATRRRPKV